MNFIKNKETLLSHGNRKLRADVLDIIEHGLYRADPYVATKNLVYIDGDVLIAGRNQFDLNLHKRIFVVGAGKATYPIAKALEEILGNRITDGVITCKHGQEGMLKHARLYHGGHPTPDEGGHLATCEMMKLARKTQPDDIVFSCMTGGMTSLMPYPPEGITIAEKNAAYKVLLRSSANIIEMNMVRKHMTRSKAGFLAMEIDKKAVIINLTVSDVIGDPLDYITDPTVPDTSTFDDARAVMTKYKLWNMVAPSIAAYLKKGNIENETPKSLPHTIHTHIIVRGDVGCVGAYEKAKELGYNAMILSNMFEGESRELGAMFAAIAKEVAINNRPLTTPCVFIGGGEATMKINIPDPGMGGPSQQFALAAATWLNGYDNIVIAGIDTDGTDGPSDMAGGIVDSSTIKKAAELGIDIYDYMDRYDDTVAITALGDAVYTGATGTNVNDLKVIAVG